jgi:hypothetical protein
VFQHIDVRDATGWLLGVIHGPCDWKAKDKRWLAVSYDRGCTCSIIEEAPTIAQAKAWIMQRHTID